MSGIAALVGGGTTAAVGWPAAIAAMAMLPFTSPRIVGEGAHLAGRVAGNVPGRAIGRGLVYGGRAGQNLNPREMVKQDAAAELENEPEKRFTKSEIGAMRAVAGGKANIDQVMAVKKVMERASQRIDASGTAGAGVGYGGPQ